jgi:hypothetical protein
MLKIATTIVLVLALASPSFAGGLGDDIANAADQAAQAQTAAASHGPMSRVALWSGITLFSVGMGVGLYGFLHNTNTGYPGYKGTDLVLNEAKAQNVPLGAAGLTVAGAGGAILFLGQRAARRSAPSITINAHGMTLAKSFSW